MANKLQTSIRAYAADNIQIKRFLRVEDAQQLFHIEDEVLLIVALSADALYQLPRTTLIHQKKMEDYMKHLYKVPKPKKNGDHPTMKPVPLLAYPIMNSSMSNTLVLDPFGGSGSTLIACEQSDRSCFTIELDEKFCDVIVKRYIEQVGSADKVSVQRDGLLYSYAEVTTSEDSHA